MSWAKGDDLYDDKPKIKKAWRLSGYAVGLHWMAVTACCRHESDGLVDPEWLAGKLGVIPRKEAEKAVSVLVDLGLFDPLPTGESREFTDKRGFTVTIGPLEEDAHIVHDYLEYNDSSAYLSDKRAKDSERKARGGSARPSPDSKRIPRGIQAESGSPDPTRPDLVPEGTTNGRVVTFDRKPVPDHRLELATWLLDDFNDQASTSYGAWTGNGKPSENLKRIIGALTRRPDIDRTWARRAIRHQLTRPDRFWDGPPHAGHVFGEGVFDQLLEATKIAAVDEEQARAARFRSLQGPVA